ncbi:MAG TPA: hypothetical protein VKV34_03260 [Thermoleophilia bacterium]|nr:hypothetical protein [Thermoleophilia bacterium]
MSAEGDPEELQRLVAQAVEGHLRRLVVGLLDLHDRPADTAALAQVRDEAQAVASALLTVDLDQLSRPARAISDTLDSLAAGGGSIPGGAVVALLDATAGLRALVAARGEPNAGQRGPESLERELAALAPWHPMTAALRAASGAAPGRAGDTVPAGDGFGAGQAVHEAWTGTRRGDASGRERLRVVSGIDLRASSERAGAHASDPAALADLLGGLSQLADVLVRATATLQYRLAELADLPELAELDAAVQALSRSAHSGPAAAAAADRRRPAPSR